MLETYWALPSFAGTGVPGAKSQGNPALLDNKGAEGTRARKDEVLSGCLRQADLVALVAKDTVGSKLKDRQYEQSTYAGTELGLIIAPIADQVRHRLDGLGVLAVSGATGDGA